MKLKILFTLLFVVLSQFVVVLKFTLVDHNTTVDLTQYINVDSLSWMFSPLFTSRNQRLWGANKTTRNCVDGFISHATPMVKVRYFYTPHSLSLALRLTGVTCRLGEGGSVRVVKVRSFSTNGSLRGGNTLNKLVINSSIEYVVFENGKAVLMLPPLKPFLLLVENSEKKKGEKNTILDYDKYSLELEDFLSSLLKVFNGLECGYYNFDWYFYICDFNNVKESLLPLYTQDPFDKDVFNLVLGKWGYKKFLGSSKYLNGEWYSENILRAHTYMFLCIEEYLRQLQKDEPKSFESLIDFNKDTLLVITKSSEAEYNELDEKILDDEIRGDSVFISALRVGETKRFYSTYGKPTSKTISLPGLSTQKWDEKQNSLSTLSYCSYSSENNKFDDLHNSTYGFCHEILTNLEEIRSSEVIDLDDLYLNIVVPHNKDKCYSSIKNNNACISSLAPAASSLKVS